MEKAKDLNELVWAKKTGRPRRQFTRLNLQSMGQDDQGRYGDGWEIVDETDEPDEVKQVKKQVAADAKAKAENAKATKSAKPAAKSPATKTRQVSAAEKKEAEAAYKESQEGTHGEQGDPGVIPTDATKPDTDNGQDQFTAEENAERGTEGSDISGSAAVQSGEGH